MTRIVENRSGVLVSTEACEVSVGAGDAGRIPQLDPTGMLDVSMIPGGGGGGGSVTTVSVTTANGVSGSVANPTTTPAISLTLGAITPTSVTASGTVTGSNLSGTHSGTSSGTNTGDQTTITGNAGSATVLATSRNFSLSGGGITSATVGFNGSGNVVLVPVLGAIEPTSVGVGTSIFSVFTLVNGAGTADTRALFRPNNAFGIGVTQSTGNGTFFIGASAAASPDLLFSNNAGTLAATLTPAGNFTAVGTVLGSNLSGTNTGDQTSVTGNAGTATKWATGRTIGITGDATYTSPSIDGTANVTAGITFATVNANVGSWGSATQVPQFTVNAKGLITAAANVTIAPAASSITGGAALTRTDDTNVTLTLGGTPTTALLAAASLTLGWTGTLSVARGGTGSGTAAGAATNLGLGTGDSPQFTAVNIGHASDTTLARVSAGDISVEGNTIYRAGGTDVAVADGGTGRSTSTTAYGLIAAGTTATGVHQTLPAGATTAILVGGGGSALPAWTTSTGTGAPVRAGSPAFTGTWTGVNATLSGTLGVKGGAPTSVFYFTHGDGSADTRGLFYSSNAFALALTQGAGNGKAYIGASAAASPDLIFSNNGGTEIGRFTTAGALTAAASITATTYIKPGVFTVATLPAAGTAGQGARAHVSDALAPAFGAAVAGGGAVSIPVYSTGAAWNVG